MMDLTAVLVPLDQSPLSESALPYAEAIARVTGAHVRLLSVIDPGSRALPDGPTEVRAHIEQVNRSAAEEYLRMTALPLTGRGIEVQPAVVLGNPVDEIVAAADDDPGSVIVMATHGRGGLERWRVGSVADKVMRIATRPTLLVRPRTAEEERRPVTIGRIALPLDGSEHAEAALPYATDLAKRCGATLVLVRVEPWVAAIAPVYGYVPSTERMDRDANIAAKTYLDQVRGRLPEDLPVHTIVLRGSPRAQLEQFALNERVDLVVMSTHGLGGFRRFIVGSVADHLVRAGAPVLLIRPPMAKAAGAGDMAPGSGVRRCATCHRLISFEVENETVCPRCRSHLHACPNCVYWDTFACVLQRPEAHDRAWPGRGCPRFDFRETPEVAPATEPRHG
jgi:nucleotide-binding universal stress UspA family protein